MIKSKLACSKSTKTELVNKAGSDEKPQIWKALMSKNLHLTKSQPVKIAPAENKLVKNGFGVNPMMSEATRRVLVLFQISLPQEDREFVEKYPEELLKRYGDILRSAGRLFKYLNLGKPDKGSPFGWGPTPLLLDIMTDVPLKVHRSNKRSEFEKLIIYLLHDAVWGDDEPRHGADYLAFEMLRKLDLVRSNSERNEYVPTPDLLRIFRDAVLLHWHEADKPTDIGTPFSF